MSPHSKNEKVVFPTIVVHFMVVPINIIGHTNHYAIVCYADLLLWSMNMSDEMFLQDNNKRRIIYGNFTLEDTNFSHEYLDSSFGKPVQYIDDLHEQVKDSVNDLDNGEFSFLARACSFFVFT